MQKRILWLVLTILLVFALVIPVSADEQLGEEPESEVSDYCLADAAGEHPMALRIVLMYDSAEHPLSYETVMGWFCEGGYGMGQIMLALQTARATGWEMTPGALLQAKTELGGWGQVWKLYGKKAKWEVPPGQAKPKKDKGAEGDEGEIEGKGAREGKGPPPWANNNKKKDK